MIDWDGIAEIWTWTVNKRGQATYGTPARFLHEIGNVLRAYAGYSKAKREQ